MKKGIFVLILTLLTSFELFSQFQINGSASSLGNNCYQITPAQNSQSGNIWSSQTISLSQSWNFYIEMQFGCSDGGADGMGFIFQQAGPTATGQVGGAMGFGGITPSLVIEFDTYHNGGSGDITADHVGIQRNGSNDHNSTDNLAGPVSILPSGGNVEDCQFHDVHVTWDHVTTTLRVYVDCNLRLTYVGNIVSTIFSNSPDVYFGFTASTGALNNDHRVCVEFVPGATRLIDESICQGDTVPVDVTPGSMFSWTPTSGVSNPTSGTPLLMPDTTTTYTVTITDPCGFNWTDSLVVDVATVDAGPNQTIGFGQNTLINSTYNGPPAVGNCNVYSQSSVTYSPYSLSSPSSISLVVGGTDFSNAIPLGFNFDFYCNTYTHAYFATGGYMTFDNGATNTTPVAIPSAAIPNNLIAYCWSSLDNMTINYETQGTAPNRRFVADILGYHWFSSAFNPPNGDQVNVQIVLFETGALEMHMNQITASWFSTMVQGIEGTGGNGVGITGRNGSMGWTVMNEGLRFEPQPANVTYTWTPNTNINDPTLEDPTVSPTVDTWYYVTRDDGNCLLRDSVLISITPLAIDTTDLPLDEDEINQFKLMPNPHLTSFQITGEQATSTSLVMELYNLGGQRVLYQIKEVDEGFFSWEIHTRDLPPGMYFYRFHAGNDWQEGKMIKR